MKKILLFLCIGLICIGFSSCNDNEKEENGLELNNYLNGEYSENNKYKQLHATINGNDIPEQASVIFYTQNFKIGNITLINLIKDYPPININDIELKRTDKEDLKSATIIQYTIKGRFMSR